MPSETVNVRYMVSDVEASIAWYTQHLGFELLSNQAPAFADVTRGSLASCSADRQIRGAADARRATAGPRRMESNSPYRRRSPCRGRAVACIGSSVPERYRDRPGWFADTFGRPFGKRRRTLSARTAVSVQHRITGPLTISMRDGQSILRARVKSDFLDHDHRIGAAERECVAHGGAHLALAGDVRRHVEVAFRVVFPVFAVGGTMPLRIAMTQAISSSAPDAPMQWACIDLVEDTERRRHACRRRGGSPGFPARHCTWCRCRAR